MNRPALDRPLPRATRRRARRGFALMSVMIAVAATSVVCWASLEMSNLDARAIANASVQQQSVYACESGIALGLHLLKYPARSIGGTTIGASGDVMPVDQVNVTFSSPCRTTVRFANPSSGTFVISTTVTDVTGTTLTRQATRVSRSARPDVDVPYAAATAGNLALPTQSTINGGLYASGSIIGSLLGVVGSLISGADAAENPQTVPAVSDLSLIANGGSYTYLDKTTGRQLSGNSQAFTWTGTGWPVDPSTAVTGGNPAAVIVINGNTTISRATTISGTLVVLGNLTVGQNLTIDPKHDGLPGLIVTGNVTFSGSRTLKIGGLTYINGTTTASVLWSSATLQVTGALLLGSAGSGTMMSTFNGRLLVDYDANKSKVIDLSKSVEDKLDVNVLAWSE